jgi:hypothetical protein
MRREFFGSAEALPSRKVIHQSLIANRHLRSLFAIRHSLLAVVSARQKPRPPNLPTD